MKRVLVVANRTLCEQHLLDAVRARKEAGPGEASVHFHLLVPASHPHGMWTDADSEREARARLTEILDVLAIGGIAATGQIGDPNPVTAVADLLRTESYDEIIVSTLPKGTSRWLAAGVVRRMGRFGLPVTHVTAEVEAAART
jgi:hypothetical protein